MRFMVEVFPIDVLPAHAGRWRWSHRAFLVISGSPAMLLMMMFVAGFGLA